MYLLIWKPGKIADLFTDLFAKNTFKNNFTVRVELIRS